MNKILVLGDICVDVNYYGNVHKISPEAPIPIFSIESKEEIPGMSGNVIRNLEAAENEVISYTKDNFDYSMTVKSRYFAGKHYLYRIDEDNTEVLKETEQSIVLGFISKIKDLKAIVLQDYHKGFFTAKFVENIIQTIRQMDENILIIADGHKSREPDFYWGVDYLKLNEEEYVSLCDKGYLFNVPKKALLITKGEKGAILKYPDKSNKHQDAFKVETVDVTGAGDTFTSWFISELVKGKTEEESLRIACIAASISVGYLGCYAPTLNEVENVLRIEHGVYG